MPPRVIVSIDAAFVNRKNLKSIHHGIWNPHGCPVGYFISSSKIQKLNSKSSTEAEIIAVSDGMNIPLWLADFLSSVPRICEKARTPETGQPVLHRLPEQGTIDCRDHPVCRGAKILDLGLYPNRSSRNCLCAHKGHDIWLLYETCAGLNFGQAFAEDFRELIIYFIDLQGSYFFYFLLATILVWSL